MNKRLVTMECGTNPWRRRFAQGCLAFATLLLALVSGCARSPDLQSHRLPKDIPSSFSASTMTHGYDADHWLHDFADPQVRAIVQRSLESNFDLRAAAARLEAATANQKAIKAGRLPTINATFSGARQKNNFQNLAGSIGTRIFNNFNFNARIAWELDLWAKVKNRNQAAIADLEAEAANYHAMRFSLAANSLRTWFNTVEAELQRQLAAKTLEAFETNLTVVEASFERGLPDRALDVRLTRANVENARNTLAFRQRQLDGTKRVLETLTGQYPSASIVIQTNLPTLSGRVPAGLPSELLHRRPDLVAAERQLAAALERTKIARKDLLPTISLSSQTGTSSGELREILDPDLLIWNIAGNISQPIFQGGRLLANIKFAKANTEQALANYAQAALNAFREVETLLAAEDFLSLERSSAEAAASESVAAEELAWQQYQRGLVDIITVLESQRRAFTSQSSLITVINTQLSNRIDLYLALGGGFELPSEESDTATTAITE